MPNFNLCTKHSLSKCPPGSGLSPLLTSIHYALLDGAVDAVAIDSHLLDEVFEHSSKMNAQLRIIGSFNATTLPPVVTSTRLDTLLRQRIREALLSIHQDTFYGQRLRESSIERFFPVTNEHYQLVAERYKKAEALSPLH